MKRVLKRTWSYITLALIVGIVDRITKNYALQSCLERFFVNQYMSCRLMFNRGVSWGLLNHECPSIFRGVTGIVILITLLVAAHAMVQYRKRKCIAGEVLILVGSCSNIYDRFVYGGVVDFIELSYGHYHWPVFNIADAAIVSGILLVVALHSRNT